jgi:hypothetical protein
MNATAAAGCTPWAVRRPAIGTEAHSHPGNAVPASAALGTARTADRGSNRSSTAGDTSAVIAPLTKTPRARNGRAWTTMATNTVVQVRNATGSSEPLNIPLVERAMRTSSTTSRPSRRRGGSPEATRVAASRWPSVDLMGRDSRPPTDAPPHARWPSSGGSTGRPARNGGQESAAGQSQGGHRSVLLFATWSQMSA